MHDGEGAIGRRRHGGRETATVGVVHDQRGDVGFVLIAQCVHFLHVAVALVGKAEHMLEVRARFHVVRLIGVDETQLHVVDAAVAERLVSFLDGDLDEVALNVGVVCCGLRRISDE